MAKVEFQFVINKQANHYFFVQNLAMWHFSNRPEYNEIWLNKLGPLSKEEKSSLTEFKKIRKKYPDSKSIFEKSFFLSKKPYIDLAKELSQKEIDSINMTMKLFRNKFEKIYGEDLPLLENWDKTLSKDSNDIYRNQEIVKKLGIFYKAPLINKRGINCFLLINPTISIGGGGANVDHGSITCEISHRPKDRINQINGVLWHETIHLLFDMKFFRPFLIDYFEEDMQKVFMYKELIASSFFPRGILGNIFFHQKLTTNLYNRFKLTEKQTGFIIQLTKRYLDSGISINEEYIKKVQMILDE